MPVFFIHSQDVVDGLVTIVDPLLTHLSKSLRTKPGDSLLFNDDQGHRYHTTVTQITKQRLQASIQRTEDLPRQTRPPIILAQALLKGEKMGWVIQKATELGITAIRPLITERVILQLSEKQEETHRARWMRIACEAAQQSERWTLPTILPTHRFQQFLETSHPSPPIVMAERTGAQSLLTIPCVAEETSRPVTVMIGPEGGWSARELDAAQATGCRFASFGKEILRAETASLAAVALLQARFQTEEG